MLNDKNMKLVFEDVKISLDGSKFIRIYDKRIKNYDCYSRKFINANIYETNNYIVVKVQDNNKKKLDYSFENHEEAMRCFDDTYIQKRTKAIFNSDTGYYVKGILKRTFDKTYYFSKYQTHIQYIDNQTSEEFINEK